MTVILEAVVPMLVERAVEVVATAAAFDLSICS